MASKSHPGLTLMELMATVVVVGIIVIGLSMTTINIEDHYSRDTVMNNVRFYGDTVMEEILKNISLSRTIDVTNANGFSRLTLGVLDSDGNTSILRVTASQTKGLQFNSHNPLNGNLQFPNGGRFKHLQSIKLTDFSIKQISTVQPALVGFANSTYDVLIEITIQPKGRDGRKFTPDVIQLNRRVFVPMKYVAQMNT